ncbi:hypothetical protein LTR56_001190 [Elasticomyces elasticus]|nr:hypothetical protein LTR22_016227 [Elasticomyces elasticus]KAK3659826.1 hypothetical protein LTR56_001190 [Elasticomyces elasticus]KAK4914298.1 hypothetical protein LTR49_017436 [Elasticomyces elasticus]KAK5769111.1 hypothetical protein LTS12_000825 [Elasticomyces elasticus]
MRVRSILCTSIFAGCALAQVATVTEYVTVPPAEPTSLTASDHNKQVTGESSSSTAQPSTFATSTNARTTSSTVQTAATVAQVASAQTSSSAPLYEGGSPGSGSDVDTDAGASGSGSSFSISKGGMIAVIVVVVLVAIFGIASTILFVVAKRRQWNIRASIRRASRRLTGRSGAPPTPRTPGRSNRQTTMNAGRLASPRVDGRHANHPGYKAGPAAVVAERDVEKGGFGIEMSSTKKPKGGAWEKLKGNDWK